MGVYSYTESNALFQWFIQNRLVVYAEKTHLIEFGINNKAFIITKERFQFHLVGDEMLVAPCAEFKLLGVTIF